MQHFAPEFRISRLKRDIDRLKAVSYNPLYVMIIHICQCDIISLQK